MKKIGWLFCRTLIEKKKKESKSLLFSFLPDSEKEIIEHLKPPSESLLSGCEIEKDVLTRVHPSWLIPFLKPFSENELSLFLSSIDKRKAEKIKDSLKVSSPRINLSKTAHQFFNKKMTEFLILQTPDLLPLKALPKSALNELLDLNEVEIQTLVELLGLHDLAVELKQIIDNTKLKKIYSIFPKEKEIFLKMLSSKKEPVTFRRMEITRWDGKAESLLALLFERGLNRLAKALYPENGDLIWYVKHQLDIEHSVHFSSLCKKLEHSKAYSFLSKQVLDALSFLRKINPNPPTSS